MTTRALNMYPAALSFGVSDVANRMVESLRTLADTTGCSIFWQNRGRLKYLYDLNHVISDQKPVEKDIEETFSESLKSFAAFIELLPSTVPAPEISIDPDGEISMDWIRSKRHIFSISIGPNNTLNFAGKFGSAKAHGFETFGGEIPDGIINNLKRLYQSNTAQ